MLGSNGEAITASNDSNVIEKLASANARLLKWRKDEGWQLFPCKGESSGFARCPDGYTQRIRKVDVLEPPQTMTEPIVVEILNWAEDVVGEPVCYNGGVDQFQGSGKYESFVPYEEPASVLKAGVLYSGENGMIICRKCAGVRESSGYLSSGAPISQITPLDAVEYKKLFGEDIRCEKGCTEYSA